MSDDIAECVECEAIWIGTASFDDALTHTSETKHTTSIYTRV